MFAVLVMLSVQALAACGAYDVIDRYGVTHSMKNLLVIDEYNPLFDDVPNFFRPLVGMEIGTITANCLLTIEEIVFRLDEDSDDIYFSGLSDQEMFGEWSASAGFERMDHPERTGIGAIPYSHARYTADVSLPLAVTGVQSIDFLSFGVFYDVTTAGYLWATSWDTSGRIRGTITDITYTDGTSTVTISANVVGSWWYPYGEP